MDLLRSTLWKNATQQVRFFGSRKRETAVRRDDETESKLVCCSNLLWQLLDKVKPSARFIADNPCANPNNNRRAPFLLKGWKDTKKHSHYQFQSVKFLKVEKNTSGLLDNSVIDQWHDIIIIIGIMLDKDKCKQNNRC